MQGCGVPAWPLPGLPGGSGLSLFPLHILSHSKEVTSIMSNTRQIDRLIGNRHVWSRGVCRYLGTSIVQHQVPCIIHQDSNCCSAILLIGFVAPKCSLCPAISHLTSARITPSSSSQYDLDEISWTAISTIILLKYLTKTRLPLQNVAMATQLPPTLPWLGITGCALDSEGYLPWGR